jgi:hypothetical protein
MWSAQHQYIPIYFGILWFFCVHLCYAFDDFLFPLLSVGGAAWFGSIHLHPPHYFAFFLPFLFYVPLFFPFHQLV